MINIKTLSAIALVTAAVSGPAFAQNEEAAAPQKPVHALRHYRSAYNQVQGPNFVAPRAAEGWNAQPGFDRSRIGDYDPDYNPAGN